MEKLKSIFSSGKPTAEGPSGCRSIILAPELKTDSKQSKRQTKSVRKCLHEYAKQCEEQADSTDHHVVRRLAQQTNPTTTRNHVQSKTPVLGSEDREVFSSGNYGFLTTVMEAYNCHYSLRTCPEDWWYTIICKISSAIDDHSKSEKVRDFFVSHEGKTTLTVQVGPSVFGVDYSWFLDQMTQQIASNIKVPNYIDLLKSDYSTSSKTHLIVSQITAMASVQEYFEYEMFTRCGIPSLFMEGTKHDWKKMKQKFLELKQLLQPIHEEIGLHSKWWNDVENILNNLLDTFAGNPNTEWWSHIFSYKQNWGSGARCTYDGWFISELLGLGRIHSLARTKQGVTSVPMKITDISGHCEESAFAAGIAGFEMFTEEDSSWPSVKAVHGWTLMLEPNSVYREDLTTWETQHTKGA